MANFYIYIYLNPRELGRYCYENFSFLYKPFYVGKGKDDRWKIKNGRTEDFINIINEIKSFGLEPIIIKLYENLSENQSFELEIKLIDEIGRLGLGSGTLINKTFGGEGSSGYKFSKESKKKMSESHKGILFSEEHKNKLSVNKKEKFKSGELYFSEETRRKISEKNKEENHPLFGKFHSKETKKKMSDKKKGKYIGENHPRHKLTEDQVIQIKLLLKEGILTQREIADIFGVSRITISDIKRGKSWSYIEI